jgi:hypothetical protein
MESKKHETSFVIWFGPTTRATISSILRNSVHMDRCNTTADTREL